MEAIFKFPKKTLILHFMFVALLALLAYSNTLNVPFHFDDKPNIVDNPVIKDLKYFKNPSENKRLNEYSILMSRYVGYLSFALNYRIHGLEVRGYHIVNLSIHIINGLLVYLLVMLTFRTPKFKGLSMKDDSALMVLFTALFFVVHPIQTQAVTYIVQRFASLAAMFYLLSLVLYIKFRIRINQLFCFSIREKGLFSSIFFYIISLFTVILAMKTKETAFTIPFIIVLYEIMFFKEKILKRIIYITPLFLTILIIPLTYLSLVDLEMPFSEVMQETTKLKQVQRLDYLFTEFRVIVTYIRLLMLPINQNLDHDYPFYHSFFDPQVMLSFSFLMIILGVGLYLLGKSSKFGVLRHGHHVSHIMHPELLLMSFGIFWFFITLSVTSSIIPLKNTLVEHRVYLPSVGAFITAMTGFFVLIKSVGNRKARAASIMILALIVCVLLFATRERNDIWRSEVTIWEDVIKKSPEKARGHNNLGNAYWSNGLFNKAIDHYLSALGLVPNNADMYSNIGIAYWSMGMIDEAIKYYKRALNFAPDNKVVHNNIGIAYASKGLFNKAIEHYQTALRVDPYMEETHNNIGNAYSSNGLIDEAIEHYLFALRIRPDSPEAHVNLANAYMSKGLDSKAIEHYNKALRLKPDYAEAHFNLGLVYFKGGFTEKARNEFKAALTIEPGYQKARKYLDLIIINNKS